MLYALPSYRRPHPYEILGDFLQEVAGGASTGSGSLFQTREAWSAVLVAGALGLSFYAAVALLERLTVPSRVQRGER